MLNDYELKELKMATELSYELSGIIYKDYENGTLIGGPMYELYLLKFENLLLILRQFYGKFSEKYQEGANDFKNFKIQMFGISKMIDGTF